MTEIRLLKQTANVQAGEVVYSPGGTFGPAVRAEYQMLFLHSGEALISYPDREVHLAPRRAALLKPGRREFWQFSKKEDTRHSWISVAKDVFGPRLRRRKAPFDVPLTPTMNSLVRSLLTTPVSDAAVFEDFASATSVAALEAFFLSAAEGGGLGCGGPEAIRRVEDYIGRNIAEKITLDDLARASAVSSKHLITIFRKHRCTTPMRFVWDERERQGVQLLQHTGLTVAEISYRVGFQSPFHFSRRIRASHGRSPRALREKFWQQ